MVWSRERNWGAGYGRIRGRSKVLSWYGRWCVCSTWPITVLPIFHRFAFLFAQSVFFFALLFAQSAFFFALLFCSFAFFFVTFVLLV
jgi:hypothetical protein